MGAAIANSGWQAVVAAHKQAVYNAGVVRDMHFEGFSSINSGNPFPEWEETTSFSALNTNPTFLALSEFFSGPTITRNVIGAPGTGPFVISGGNYQDSLGGANPTLNGSGFAPYPSSNGYKAWLVYSTTGGTYQLTVQSTGGGNTDVEYASYPSGFTKLTNSGSHYALPITSSVPVVLAQGWNYLALGTGTNQAGSTITSLTLN